MLVHNAGFAHIKRKVSKDGNEMTKQVNFLGVFWLTHLLWDLVAKGKDARIISVNSLAHRLNSNLLSLVPVGLSLDDFNFDKRKYEGLLCYS